MLGRNYCLAGHLYLAKIMNNLSITHSLELKRKKIRRITKAQASIARENLVMDAFQAIDHGLEKVAPKVLLATPVYLVAQIIRSYVI